MSLDAPHLMILDEPTNHLDIDSREALVSALNAYEGAVVLISHDPHLIELAADRLWLVADGEVHSYDGDLEDYKQLLLDKAREARRNGREPKDASPNRKDARRAAAELRLQIAPLRKVAQQAERHVEQLGKKKAALQAKLADPALYDAPPDKLTALQRELGDVAKSLAEAEEAWLKAQVAIEEASAAG